MTRTTRDAVQRSGIGAISRGLIPDWLDAIFLRSVIPVIRRLSVNRVDPNTITVTAFGLTFLGAALVVTGRLVWAGAFIVLGGILDFVDGKVAELQQTTSTYGAVLDSTLDRLSDASVCTALVVFFGAAGYPVTAITALLALIGSMLTSYLMALGKSHGFTFRTGVLRRQDRVTILAAGLLLSPLDPVLRNWFGTGSPISTVPAPVPVTVAVFTLAGLGLVTAAQRFARLRALTRHADGSPPSAARESPEGEESLRDKQLRILHEVVDGGQASRRRQRGLLRPYTELLRNFAADVVSVRTGNRLFLPLMTNFYVTKRCNLRCRYCYPPGDEPELPLVDALALLNRIRPRNPALNLTGGEPLLYPGIENVIRRARELEFRPLLLSTNGILIERVLPELELLDHVVISLDSLSVPANECMTGVPDSTEKIVRSIDRCAELAARHGFQLSLHAVVAPETIDGIEDVLDYCERIGATLSLSPEHGQFLPHRGLPGTPEYAALIDRLLELKARGKPLFCSAAYLEAIRDFTRHRCYPWVSPRVEPDGRVYLPCQRMKHRHVFLQDYPNLVELMRQESELRPDPACAERCHLACYVEVERYLHAPWLALKELSMRHALMGRGSASPSRSNRVPA